MTSEPSAPAAPPSRIKRILLSPVGRIIFATFFTALAGGLTLSFSSAIADKDALILWPEALAASAVLWSYWIYVRWLEKRPVVELSGGKALLEFTTGLLTGTLMVLAVIGMAYASGAYAMTGMNDWSMAIVLPLAQMTFVGVFEEILCRGIVFRIAEQSLGSWAALAISALLFGLAHVPGSGAGFLAISVMAVAGVFFSAAYMLTRRLWLCIGIHIAWNYVLGTIFSIPVSGHESNGLLLGTLSGPDWITGGLYGLEATIYTLFVLATLGGYFLWRAKSMNRFVPPFWLANKSNPTASRRREAS
jgi:membrane protease YdiL (CAAX protease family)